jgi:dUTP pyrophosphatase
MISKIRVKNLSGNPELLPSKGSSSAAGYDLRANITEETSLPPGGAITFKCGFIIEIPEGFFGLVAPRSGLAFKHGITLSNNVGIIDSDFRGEMCVRLTNHGAFEYKVKPLERVGQILILPVENQFTLEVVDELTDTARGSGGFGSTGRQ